MSWIAFFLGLAVGIGLWGWQRWRFYHQLQQLLQSFPDRLSEAVSLSVAARLRRAIAHLHQQSQQSQERWQSWQGLLEIAPLGYLQVDDENHLLWCNRRAREWLKIDRWQPGQVRLLLELVRSYELDRLIELTRREGRPQVCEWVYHTTEISGDLYPALRSLQPLALKAWSYPLVAGEVGVFLENQQPLVELSRSRERAFSVLTHELRTPLTSIRLVAETLSQRLQPPESVWSEQMLHEINRLILLVEDWLTLAELEKNPRRCLNLELLHLHDTISSAWTSLAPLAEQKQLQLHYDEQPEALVLEGDRLRLIQVFLNLFDNGIRHSPSGAAVQVKARLGATATPGIGEQVEIEIVDSGRGFSDVEQSRVFDRFYRGSSRQTGSGGTGLGLAIAQQIILAHDGSISAQNHPETGGAWLQIVLPQRQYRS